MEKVHLVYYSPAFSTRKILRIIGKGIASPAKEYDITQGVGEPLLFGKEDLVILGVPVYSGRVPAPFVDIFQKIKGENTPAVLVCVYGNRDYDDALLELADLSKENGFIPFAGAAFIARHSIFPKIAENRPDDQDKLQLMEFGEKCYSEFLNLNIDEDKELKVRGNHPYREPSNIPFVPKADSTCDNCGTCVKLCPTHAIPEGNPKKTNKDICIACARCIAACPKQSRRFKGLVYNMVRKKFESSYAERKEPDIFFT
ncbi:4Fe-4S binding protein [Prevotella sp. 10(H)]|uniref:4Fe-4S binding protein n=1 Tax=Prevotella sp. 10(H) TaxID=1158294 RepID=UPI0004A72FD2|nr:4Fe-4S binding protein [Prevotella sp. 10(H)]